MLLWFDEWDDEEEIIREIDALVLNALKPPPNCDDLSIGRYEGPTMFPNWMMSLTKLKKFYIDGLFLEHLPLLGKLSFLKSLHIEDGKYLKR